MRNHLIERMKGIGTMSFCTNCGSELSKEFAFCPECGTKIISESNTEDYLDGIPRHNRHTRKCKNCGDTIPDDAFYCLNCETTLHNPIGNFEDSQNRVSYRFGIWKNKWISFFLCLFFGWLGAHKFYEGSIFMGLLYLFTLGLFGIGWIIDLIILLLKPNPYFVKKKDSGV